MDWWDGLRNDFVREDLLRTSFIQAMPAAEPFQVYLETPEAIAEDLVWVRGDKAGLNFPGGYADWSDRHYSSQEAAADFAAAMRSLVMEAVRRGRIGLECAKAQTAEPVTESAEPGEPTITLDEFRRVVTMYERKLKAEEADAKAARTECRDEADRRRKYQELVGELCNTLRKIRDASSDPAVLALATAVLSKEA